MRLDVLNDLNPEQREAALCQEHSLVIALPGSGKTKTLAAKAAFVLSDPKSRLAAVTFTRDAALELRERIVRVAGPEVLPRLIVGTYHSVDLLMAFPDRVKPGGMGSAILKGRSTPFKNPWKIADEGHRRSYIFRALQQSGLDIEFEEASKLLEVAKDNPSKAVTFEQKKLLQIYRELMERHGEIDFQDIILKTNKALADGTLSPLAVDVLLLDEYQDTDLKQYTWASEHGRAGVKITAVGDDDQAIYGFRNAMGYEGMQLFRQQFRAEQIILGTNYRSHEEVLVAATNVIIKNENRTSKVVSTHKGFGGMVEWEGFADRELEADACALEAGKAAKLSETYAVLSRTSARLDEVESRLIVRNVPYIRAEGGSILDHRESALFCSIVESLYKPSTKTPDEVMAWCQVSEQDVEKIHRMSGGKVQRLHPSEMIKAGIEEKSRSIWNKFCKFHAEWKEQIKANHSGSSFLVRQGIYLQLCEFTSDKRSLSRLKTINDIFEPGSSGTLLERLKLLRDAQSAQKQKDKNGVVVTLMTAHGSKGLEFDHVWIIGAEEEVFPHKDGVLDEERRLFYVAMTRARRRLTISKSGVKAPSRFVIDSAIERAPMDKYVTKKPELVEETADTTAVSATQWMTMLKGVPAKSFLP